MFWKFATTSNVDTLLEREDITLIELLDDDDVLQECKGQNNKLIEFLCKPEVMEELVTLIVTEPSGDVQENLKYKYSNLACELLVSDVAQMNDMLGDTEVLREKLFSFLETETTLNPLLASFFSKVVGILLTRKPEPTLEYIKSKDDFLGKVLKHLGTSAIMDLLLRLVTCVEALELRAQVLVWLNENNLVERLISLIDPSKSEDFHCNSAQSLCDIIRLSREHMYTMQENALDDPLLNALEKKETVEFLLKHMFDHGINESVIINGISVLLALLEIRRPAPFGFPEMAPELTQLDVERLARGVSKTLEGLSDRLPDFHKLLESPPKRDIMQCTFGALNPPLGSTRLHVCKLLSAILITNTHNTNVQLTHLRIFNVLLDLFFRYEYNNFLHTQVVQCLQTVLANAVTVTSEHTAPFYSKDQQNEDEQSKDDEDYAKKDALLLTHLFEDSRVIQRILDAWEDNRIHETEVGGHRKGHMGHLTLIANQIMENMDKGINAERIKMFISGMPEEDQGRWQKFVSDQLNDMNEKNARELGGHNPMHFSSDDDADTDYRELQFTAGSTQQFGFTDADFGDQDDQDKFNKITSDFDIKAETNTASQVLFQNVCKARLPNLDDSSDEEEDPKDMFETGDQGEDWEDQVSSTTYKYNNTTPTISVRERTNSNSSSGDDEPTSNDVKMAVEMAEPSTTSDWQATFDNDMSDSTLSTDNTTTSSSSVPVVSTTHVNSSTTDVDRLWEESNRANTSSEDNTGWANFDNFESFEIQKQEISTSSLPARASSYFVDESTPAGEGDISSSSGGTKDAWMQDDDAPAVPSTTSESMDADVVDDEVTPSSSSSNNDVTMEDVDKISTMVTSSCETSPPPSSLSSHHNSSSPMETEVSSTSDTEETTNVAPPTTSEATASEAAPSTTTESSSNNEAVISSSTSPAADSSSPSPSSVQSPTATTNEETQVSSTDNRVVTSNNEQVVSTDVQSSTSVESPTSTAAAADGTSVDAVVSNTAAAT